MCSKRNLYREADVVAVVVIVELRLHDDASALQHFIAISVNKAKRQRKKKTNKIETEEEFYCMAVTCVRTHCTIAQRDNS